jgi:hypothetical protein
MRESKAHKVIKVKTYILLGLTINHPQPFIISRQNNKLRNLGISYPVFVRVFKELVDSKIVNMVPGKFYNKIKGKKGKGKSLGCVLTPGSSFNKEKIIIEFPWIHECRLWFPNVKDIIKSSSGKMKLEIPLFDDFIGQINNLNRKHEFVIGPEVLNVELQRFRSSGDDMRIYSKHGFQRIPKNLRKNITIDEEEIVEIDINSCHLSILGKRLSASGRPPEVTNFDFDDYRFSRDRVKRVFYIFLNAETPKIACKSICKRFKLQPKEVKDLMTFVLEYFNEYSEFLFKGIWKGLQIEEALICDHILRGCVLRSIPIMPIFDSFLVQKKNARFVCNLLDEMRMDYSILFSGTKQSLVG